MNIGAQNIQQSSTESFEHENLKQRPRILFVDDEIPIVLGLKRNLRQHFEVEGALGGRQALDMMKETGEFAVVVSDMRMPDMDGATFLKEVRNLFPATVRIMLTGDQDRDTPQEAINRGGVFRLLHKPCGADDMEKILLEALHEYDRVKDQRKRIEKLLHSFENEMATPLHILLEFSDQWASDTHQPEYVRDYCRTICDKVKELSEQTNRFLTFMSLKDYQSRASTQWLELPLLLEIISDAVRGKLVSRDCELSTHAFSDLEGLKVEFRSMHMILSILVSAAIELVPSNSRLQLHIGPNIDEQQKVCIRLNAIVPDPELRLPAISLAQLEQQLVEQLCDLHSGHLELSDEDNNHQIFSLTLKI
ncbi:response regulator [Cohaesibacter gelatinilyticus]|uniref:Response regulator receiver domain-containing protein n=1 Tax=Cohaesibacter gelatinilyticus TaxID=372072 RepID=A0A285PF61_9HYPH|nr:response regulator [Cohaesibacter gelatinilyticus]SNZ20352.1 Response regulator receiver domain-containing protein [Cohaesibacter gelatinilyticus]